MWRYRYINIKLLKYPLAILGGITLLVIFLFFRRDLPDAYLPQGEKIPAGLHCVVQTDGIKLPAKADVYQIKNGHLDEKEVEKLAKHFKINGKINYDRDNREWVVYKDNRLLIAREVDGQWLYRYFARQPNVNLGKDFLSDEEITRIATEMLTSLGINNDEFIASTVGSTTADKRVVQKSVYFYRHINDYQILGEAQLIMDIDAAGQLIGLSNALWSLQSQGKYKLKTLTEAVAEIENNQALYNLPVSIIGDPVIYQADLAYYRFADKKLQPSLYLQPVYLFSGEVETQSGPMEFNVLVPAVKGVTLKYIGTG